MRGPGPRSYLSLAMVAALLTVLALLAFFQNRWITQLSDAERERLQSSLERSSEQLCDAFDRELTRASQVFRIDEEIQEGELAAMLGARLARWRSTAPFPQLVKELLVVTRLAGGAVSLSRLDEGTGQLVPSDWDDGLSSVRQIFSLRGPVPILDELLPGLVLPVRATVMPGGWEPRDAQDRRPPRDHVIVRLDREYVSQQFLPSHSASVFGGRSDLAYSVIVRVAGRPDEVILAAGPQVAGNLLAPADTVRSLFSLRFFPDLANTRDTNDSARGAPAPPQASDDQRGAPEGQRPPPPRRQEDRGGARERQGDAEPSVPRTGGEVGKWILEVRHPAGSLDAVVAGARRRNLAISLAIVGLLGAVGVLMVVSTRRAQRLARQQIDFVAGVSHELRTPLTAMRSAGQNLADGIVHDPERVRSYGALIEREGRRLTEMVSRVLAFAGIQSGQPTYQMHPLAVRTLIDGVLSDSRWVLEEQRFEVESNVADDLPDVRGDASALRQALSNLVDNAMKHGAPAKWVSVRAQVVATPRGEEVVVAVSDRGTGIRRTDLAHLFEPFFRGSDARVAATPGSGLGLAVVKSIVEAHGGRITVDTAPGRGSTFTIYLPAVMSTTQRKERP